jgi:hypothetical protein
MSSSHQHNVISCAASPAKQAATNPSQTSAPHVGGSETRTPKINQAPVQNRLLAIMAHTTRYAFKGESRLAADASISKSALCRLVNGQSTPSFPLVVALTQALERHLKRAIDPREIVSINGTYPTYSVCELCGCKGCLPAEAYDEENRLKPEWKDVKPGEWATQPRCDVVPLETQEDALLPQQAKKEIV